MPERRAVLDVLHEPRFADQAPAEVYARLLDEKVYLCSQRTINAGSSPQTPKSKAARSIAAPDLQEAGAARDRAEPGMELGHHEAARPDEVDLLLGLCVLLDIFSRYVVGWMIAHRESATLAKKAG